MILAGVSQEHLRVGTLRSRFACSTKSRPILEFLVQFLTLSSDCCARAHPHMRSSLQLARARSSSSELPSCIAWRQFGRAARTACDTISRHNVRLEQGRKKGRWYGRGLLRARSQVQKKPTRNDGFPQPRLRPHLYTHTRARWRFIVSAGKKIIHCPHGNFSFKGSLLAALMLITVIDTSSRCCSWTETPLFVSLWGREGRSLLLSPCLL